MDKGDVKSWKTAFLQNATTQTRLDLETWADFLTKLKEDFKPYDAPGDALDELSHLWLVNYCIRRNIGNGETPIPA
jgi:DNA-directed RNA polymerase subunit N (RpoN/RPB10)